MLETAPDRVISYAYDIYGNVTGHAQYETADRTGNALSSATAGVVPLQTGKTFNSRRLLAIATFSGTGLPSLTFNYTYDSYGNMSTHTQATAVFNGQAASTKTATFTVFDGWGNALNGRNLEGAMFTHTYDTRGRNTLLRIVSVTGLVSQSTMQYDAIGQLFRMSFPQTQSNGQIIQRLQQNTYNTAQQLIRTTLDGSQIWPELNPQPNNLLFEFKTSIFLNDLFAPIKNTDAQKTTIISSGSITCSGSDCISPPLCPTNSGGVGVCPDALERPKPKRDFKDLCEPYPKMKKTCEFCVQIACAFAKPTCCKIQNDKCLSDSQGEISAVTQCNVQQGLCLIR